MRLTTDAQRRRCLLCRTREVERWRALLGGSYCTCCTKRINREVRAQRLRVRKGIAWRQWIKARTSRDWRHL
jgi:hypothetical protein